MRQKIKLDFLYDDDLCVCAFVPEVKRFTRGDRDFMTRMTTPIQLTCLHLDADSELTCQATADSNQQVETFLYFLL